MWQWDMVSYKLVCNYTYRDLWRMYCGAVMSLFWYVALLNLEGIHPLIHHRAWQTLCIHFNGGCQGADTNPNARLP